MLLNDLLQMHLIIPDISMPEVPELALLIRRSPRSFGSTPLQLVLRAASPVQRSHQ